MHHFLDDRNLLYSSSSLKNINRYINHDLKLIFHWLRAKRISLNVDKTDISTHILTKGQNEQKTQVQDNWPKIFLKSSEASRPYTKSVCNIVVSYTHAESQVKQSK